MTPRAAGHVTLREGDANEDENRRRADVDDMWAARLVNRHVALPELPSDVAHAVNVYNACVLQHVLSFVQFRGLVSGAGLSAADAESVARLHAALPVVLRQASGDSDPTKGAPQHGANTEPAGGAAPEEPDQDVADDAPASPADWLRLSGERTLLPHSRFPQLERALLDMGLQLQDFPLFLGIRDGVAYDGVSYWSLKLGPSALWKHASIGVFNALPKLKVGGCTAGGGARAFFCLFIKFQLAHGVRACVLCLCLVPVHE